MDISCTAAIWYATHACEQVTRMCTSTHVEMKAHTKGLDVIFMFLQLLCAESLPAGCVWSRCDAIHQTEEGRSHWDPAASVLLSAWCHPLARSPLPLSVSFSLTVTPTIPLHLPGCITPLPLSLLSFFIYFMCSCPLFSSGTIINSAANPVFECLLLFVM